MPLPVPASVTVSANCCALKFAVTDSAALIVIVQLPVPLHAGFPLQPVNVLPAFAFAANVTDVPLLKFAVHALGHEIPEMLVLVTEPSFGAFCMMVTVSGNVVAVLNVAVTLSAALIVIVHVLVPLHAAFPLQPANVEPVPAVAVKVTTVPLVKFAEHVEGQVIPAGLLDTVPVPVPASVTFNANVVAALNVAVTLSAAFIVIVQVPVPLHAAFPLQPANTVPVLAEAVSVTGAPLLKFAEQVLGQEMPAGLLVTVPAVPVPASVTVSANC